MALKQFQAELPEPLNLPKLWLLQPSCLVLRVVQFVKTSVIFKAI